MRLVPSLKNNYLHMNEETKIVLKAIWEWSEQEKAFNPERGVAVRNAFHYALDRIELPRGPERTELIKSFNAE